MTIEHGSIDRALRWLGVVTWTATLALTGLCLSLLVTASGPPLANRFGISGSALVGFCILQMTCASAAILIVARVPRNLVAWLLFGIGLSYGVASASIAWVLDAGTRPGTSGLAEIAWLSQTAGLIPGALTSILILVFPRPLRGSFPVAFAVISAVVISLLAIGIPAMLPGPLLMWETIENPFGIGPRMSDDGSFGLAFQPAILAVGLILCSAWIAWRYRHGERLERLQLKWFASAGLVSLVALGVSGVSGAIGVGPETGWWSLLVYAIAGSAVPIAICIAILRYHLYAIDRLINRVVVYTAVTALLAATFAVVAVIIGGTLAAVTPEYQTIAVAVSTLTVAALFSPIRRRIQRVVDRRFDRERYDAAGIAETFSNRLRDTIDLEELEAETMEVVRRTLRPATAGVWVLRGR